jgi:hypothetical protein
MSRTRNSLGFTLLETTISLALIGVLLTSVLSITVETASFIGDTDVDNAIQMEGNRAFQRLAEVLRKSGRSELAGVSYPRVTAGGSEVEFRILTDLDGNGYPFEESTGVLEWSPTIYTVKAEPSGDFGIYDGGTKVYHLARFIFDVSFETANENPARHFKEILVSFQARRSTRAGADLAYETNGSIHMRN